MEEPSPTPKGPLIELHVTSPLVEPPGSTSSGVCLAPPVDGRGMPPPHTLVQVQGPPPPLGSAPLDRKLLEDRT